MQIPIFTKCTKSCHSCDKNATRGADFHPSCKKRYLIVNQKNMFNWFSEFPQEQLNLLLLSLLYQKDLVNHAMLINTHWKSASHWVIWWLHDSHLLKLTYAYSEIPFRDIYLFKDIWDSSPATNNPCESNNKVSKPATLCAVDQALQHVYYEDR